MDLSVAEWEKLPESSASSPSPSPPSGNDTSDALSKDQFVLIDRVQLLGKAERWKYRIPENEVENASKDPPANGNYYDAHRVINAFACLRQQW